ncbi:MAG: hypothetical protein RSJ41_09615 [Clostridia bacterium]
MREPHEIEQNPTLSINDTKLRRRAFFSMPPGETDPPVKRRA